MMCVLLTLYVLFPHFILISLSIIPTKLSFIISAVCFVTFWIFLSTVNWHLFLFIDDLQRGTFFAFGYGPHACIGKHFAMVEMKVTIVQLLKHFRFTIDPGCEDFIRTIEVTVKLTPDLKIRIHKLWAARIIHTWIW